MLLQDSTMRCRGGRATQRMRIDTSKMCIRDRTEGHLELVVLALDGAGLLEGVAQALVHEALEALLLHGLSLIHI